MIAYLEADSFLAELGRELQEDAIAKMKQYAGLGASRRDECFHQGLHKGDNDDRQSNGMEALHFKGSQSSDYHNTVMGN
jgi:hypothetical protein